MAREGLYYIIIIINIPPLSNLYIPSAKEVNLTSLRVSDGEMCAAARSAKRRRRDLFINKSERMFWTLFEPEINKMSLLLMQI